MDRLSFDKADQEKLSAVPAAAHQENVALDVLRAAWRRRRLVIGTALLAAIGGFGVTMLRPVRYPAEALIELHLGRADPATSVDAPATSVVVEAASIVLGEARIIRSSMVARRVVERLGLADEPGFSGEGIVSRAMNGIVGFFSQRGKAASRARRIAGAEAKLAAGLSVQTDNRSYLISITYSAPLPDEAARIANAVAQEYLARRLETDVDAAGNTAEWLNGQITTTEAQLRSAEAAVATFRKENRLIELGPQNDNLQQQQLRELATQLNAASVARIAEEARLSRIETLAQNGTPASASELQALPLIQAAVQREADAERALADLQSRYGPKHPAVQQGQSAVTDARGALAAETDRAVASLRANVATTRATEQDLYTRVEAIQQSLIGDSAKEAQLRNLQTTAEGLRERLQALVRNHAQALALRDLRVVPASLVVPAQAAEQPAGPNAFLVSLLSLIGGCLAGVALAALLERFDHGLRTSNDVTAATDLRCLGLVPELLPDDPALTAASRFAIASAQIVFYEAVRVVASSVGLFGSGHGDGGRIVLVTSAVPGEGRSTLCAGLARSLSLTGRRVLLIDGPPCRFDQTGPREPGPGSPQTSDAGPQQAKPAEGALVVLQRKSAAGFALDVFGSPRLGPALEEARRHFDVILIEGPPIMLIADALVLGRIADIVIHVARWADTKRRTVHAAVQRMEEHGVIVDGVVLMRVDVEKHAKLNLGDHGSYHLRPHDYYERAAQPAGGHLAAVMREPGSKSQHMFDEDAAKHGSARGPNTRKLG